jgi:hypothetical protein
MKKLFKMMGIFCDQCGANLTLTNHVGAYKGDFKKPKAERDFCDDKCRDKYIKKHPSWK